MKERNGTFRRIPAPHLTTTRQNKMPLLAPPTNDAIYLSNLALTTTIAPGDVWSRAGKPTPVTLSVRLILPSQDLARAGDSDNVEHTVSYGTLAKEVMKAITSKGNFSSLREFAEHVSLAALVLAGRKDVAVETRSVLPEGLLLAEGVGVETRLVGDPGMMSEQAGAMLFVDRLRVACVVGVNPHERLQKQWVVIDLRLWEFPEDLWTMYPAAMRTVVDVSLARPRLERDTDCRQTVKQSEFLTIETLATEIAMVMCVKFFVELITVAVEKPSALTFAKGSGVEITRSRKFFTRE